MKPDVEALIVQWGNSVDELPSFHSEVPKHRPNQFITVERTGGESERFRDLPTVAIQAWAETRAEASDLIRKVEHAVNTNLRFHENIARITTNAITNFPGPEGEQRYQALLSLVVV